MKKFLKAAVFFMLLSALLCGCDSGGDDMIYSRNYELNTDKIDEVEIEWVGGEVHIESSALRNVGFAETGNKELEGTKALKYELENGTLKIKFSEAKSNVNLKKNLTVYLPANVDLDELDVGTVSGNIIVDGISASVLKLSTVSGDITVAQTEKIDELVAEDTSGKVDINVQEIGKFRLENVSGDLRLAAAKAPKKGIADNISGKIELYLPETADFSLETDTKSGAITGEFDMIIKDKTYVYGSGANKYELKTISGSMFIGKYKQ